MDSTQICPSIKLQLSDPILGLRSNVKPPAQKGSFDPVIFKLRRQVVSVAFARP